jgi:hypothetical protein
MKEPNKHIEICNENIHQAYCDLDGEGWPCKTWRKWLKSDSYRLAELEAKFEGLMIGVTSQRDAIDNLKYSARLDAATIHALIMAVNNGGGHIDVGQTQDVMNMATFFGSPITLPGRKDFIVTYKFSGETWENGKLVQRDHSGG